MSTSVGCADWNTSIPPPTISEDEGDPPHRPCIRSFAAPLWVPKRGHAHGLPLQDLPGSWLCSFPLANQGDADHQLAALALNLELEVPMPLVVLHDGGKALTLAHGTHHEEGGMGSPRG